MHLASMQRQVFSDKHWVCRMILESGPRIVVLQTQCAQNNVDCGPSKMESPRPFTEGGPEGFEAQTLQQSKSRVMVERGHIFAFSNWMHD